MYIIFSARRIIFTVLVLLVTGLSYAVGNNLPAGTIEQIDPGRTGEELTPQSGPPSLTAPDVLKINIPADKIKIDKSGKIAFTLGGIIIEGNTIFSDDTLAKLYRNKRATKITIDDVQGIAKTITAYYRNAGYILARVVIPPQEVDASGILKLQVIEGHVDRVIIQGKLPKANKRLLESYGKHISNQNPLNISTLERFALLANDIPGATIKTILQPSEKTPGASDLIFVAKQERTGWYAGANNFNSELLGRNQMVANIHTNGQLSASQTSALGIMGFSIKRLKYIAFQHRQQLNSNGLGFDASVSNTNTDPNFSSLSLNYFNTPGQAFIAVANSTYPITRSRQENLFVGGGVNYINSHTDFAGQNLFYDAIRSINAKVSYNFLDKYLSSNSVEFSITQGLNIFAARAAPPSIPGGKTNFSKVNLSANRYQPLPVQNVFMLLWIKGQYSFTQLLSSEKFGFGGSPFGYGYDPSVITGDQGYELKLELQYNYWLNKFSIPKLQLFGFADNASVWNINKSVQIGFQAATSMGGGLRMTAFKKLYMEFIVAQPFNRLLTNNNSKSTRLLFNVTYNGGEIFG